MGEVMAETRPLPLYPEEADWLNNLRVGDPVERWLGGEPPPMKLRVTAIKKDLIVCGWYTFDLASGAEVDEALGWRIGTRVTGSYIRAPAH